MDPWVRRTGAAPLHGVGAKPTGLGREGAGARTPESPREEEMGSLQGGPRNWVGAAGKVQS